MVGQDWVLLHLHVFLHRPNVHLHLTHVEVDVDVHLEISEFLREKKSVTNSHPLQQEEEGNDEGDEDDAGMVGDGVEEELPLLPHELHQVVQQHVCFNLLLLYLFQVLTCICFPALAVFLPTVRSVFVACLPIYFQDCHKTSA